MTYVSKKRPKGQRAFVYPNRFPVFCTDLHKILNVICGDLDECGRVLLVMKRREWIIKYYHSAWCC